jgi:uncharacterized protein HemX
MKNNMKKMKSNKTGKVLGTILMVIGAGAFVGFFSSQKNRSKTQEKALELGNYVLGKVDAEKNTLISKAKELIRKTKSVEQDIDGLLSTYEKKTI